VPTTADLFPIAALALAAYALFRSDRTAAAWRTFLQYQLNASQKEREETVRQQLRLFQDGLSHLSHMEEKVLMLKGLHPHLAAEDSFMPSGVSRAVHDEMATAYPATPAPGETVADEILTQIEQDKAEWQSLQQAAELAGVDMGAAPESIPVGPPASPPGSPFRQVDTADTGLTKVPSEALDTGPVPRMASMSR